MSDESKQIEQAPDAAVADDSKTVVIPPEAVEKAAREGRPLTLTIQALTAHSGPLPSPPLMRGYDEVYPGLSKIIVDQFQLESGHRRRLQNVGQIGALGVALLSIVCGTALAYHLGSWPAALAIIGPVCGTLGTAQLLEFWFKWK